MSFWAQNMSLDAGEIWNTEPLPGFDLALN
jgi:hypothetical protein